MSDPFVTANVGTFVDLSVVLTGVDKNVIAPFADQDRLKVVYLSKLVAEVGQTAVTNLLAAFTTMKGDPPQKICDALLNAPARPGDPDNDFRFLARNILKMWYLGAWFPRGWTPATNLTTPYKVISSNTYKEGFAWKAMQAHPMGFSRETSFGYWEHEPPALDVFLPRAQPASGTGGK